MLLEQLAAAPAPVINPDDMYLTNWHRVGTKKRDQSTLASEMGMPNHVGSPCTPAMAAGLTDHVWSLRELLSYRIAPSPWTPPKKRGRKACKPTAERTLAKPSRLRPLLRLRKGVLCPATG